MGALATEARARAYRRVLERHGIDPTNGDTSANEDAAFYLDPEDVDYPLQRFCVVTAAGDVTYAVPKASSLDTAQLDAVENIDDSIYAEGPVEIVDLDTGDIYRPDWARVPWVKEA